MNLFTTQARMLVLLAILVGSAHAELVTLTLTNPGFETGDATGWTLSTKNGRSLVVTSGSAHAGTYKIGANGGSYLGSPYTASQTVNIDIYASDIDAGRVTTDVSYWAGNSDNYDLNAASLQFFNGLDGSGASLGTETDPDTNTTSTWRFFTIGGGTVPVPSGTRSMKITLMAKIGSAGTAVAMDLDDVSASLDVTPPTGTLIIIQ